MPVDVDGQRHGRVAELALHPGQLSAVLERDPSERVAERMEVALTSTLADARDARPLERRIEDVARQVARLDVAAVLSLEDDPFVARLGQPDSNSAAACGVRSIVRGSPDFGVPSPIPEV